MKIAILTELFPPSVGGQEIRFAEISRVLTSYGHSVHIFCIRNVPGTPSEEVLDDIAIHRHPEAYNYQRPAFKWLRRRPFVVLSYALWCRRIDPSSFDLFIFNQWPLAHILLAYRAMRAKSVIDWCEFRSGPLFSSLQKILPRLVACNIANSLELKCKLETLSGRPFEFLPSGVDRDRYRTAPAAQRHGALYVGRITEHKNLPLVLSCYEILVSKGYTGRLRIAGSGPALSNLRNILARSKVASLVDILGFVDDGKKVELLGTSEVLLLTSKREGFPRVIAEAMASGLPVVTADYPENGAKDIVRQYGVGRVTEPVPGKLSDGVFEVLDDWEHYSQLCISASYLLDWDVVINSLLRVAVSCSRLS